MFDLSKPHVRAIPSPADDRGIGGWVLPLTVEGEAFLEGWFGEQPTEIASLGYLRGFIVEPSQSADLAEALLEAELAWVVGKD
jgi:hypothetical protein